MADVPKIVVLEGDETGQELLEESLRVIDPDVIAMELELEHYDLSLEHRRATSNAVVEEAAAAMKQAGFGLKAATVTPEGLSPDARHVMRQALAGLLWSKQFYHYEVSRWLRGNPAEPPPPRERLSGRNHDCIVPPERVVPLSQQVSHRVTGGNLRQEPERVLEVR